ncbi:MAG: RNA-binding S4 domain-containing protein [Veillonellaceae bacterium]|nr:RNA-binding S4 domain-containing protein [Veillonellaceae bacterium]
MKREIAEITTEFIQLDQLLKWLGITETGGQARFLVDEGRVTVNGVVVYERRKKIVPGDLVCVDAQEYLVVKQISDAGL